jgi:uncharacterized protein
MLQFDPDKDAANIIKHNVSLSAAANLVIWARVRDDRFAELRYRAYGTIEGIAYCLAYTIREGAVRAISLRRAHKKEMARYGR